MAVRHELDAIMACVSALSDQTGDEAVTELELKYISFSINMIFSHFELKISSD